MNRNEQKLLLYSKSKKKYQIYFTSGGRRRYKTSLYIGPFLGLMSNKNDMFGMNKEKFSKPHLCPICNGSRLINEVKSKKVFGSADVNYFLTTRFDEVESVIKKIRQEKKYSLIDYSCDYILKFIEECKALNISHLNFSRAIYSLSGGELQRLRIAQLLLGRLKNLMIVLDEPTSSLNPKEADLVIKKIKKLSKNNTIIVVDHNEKLRKIANRAFFLGPRSGKSGGQLIPESEYLKMQKASLAQHTIISGQIIKIPLYSDYVKYGDKLTIHEKALNGICGPSGIGKTTILRDVLPYQLNGYKYISQKPIKAGRTSTIASFIGLLDEVRQFFSDRTKVDKKIFMLSQDGACPKCGGKGTILIGNYYGEQLFIECEECNGTGYSKKTLLHKINGMDIYEFLEQSVEEIHLNEIDISRKFNNTIKILSNLGLGHLVLNQKTNTLSGGENQRLKLSQAFVESKYKIFGLDEPLKGLGQNEMLNLVNAIFDNIEKYDKTFVIAEHNNDFLNICSFVSELVLKEGVVHIVTYANYGNKEKIF